MAKMKRLNNISGIGKNVGELEFSDIAGRNVKWNNYFNKQFGIFLVKLIKLIIQPQNSRSTYWNKRQTLYPNNNCTWVLQ